MGIVKNKKRYSGLIKYNKLVSTLVKDKKKRKETYQISDIRALASSIYPNFKETPLKRLKKRDILSAKPQKLLPTQRKYVAEEEPDIVFPDELTDLEERYYFDIYKMLGTIEAETSNNITFISKVEGSENIEFQGGTQLEPTLDLFYQTNFSQFVKYIDVLRNQNKIDYSSLRVICTNPEKVKGKYVSYIIITDAEGNSDLDDDLKTLIDGFDPTMDYSVFTKKDEAPTAPVEPKKPSKKDAIEIAKIEAQERIEMRRLELIDKYYQDALAGKISWDRYDKMIADLYKKD